MRTFSDEKALRKGFVPLALVTYAENGLMALSRNDMVKQLE